MLWIVKLQIAKDVVLSCTCARKVATSDPSETAGLNRSVESLIRVVNRNCKLIPVVVFFVSVVLLVENVSVNIIHCFIEGIRKEKRRENLKL